MWLFWLKILSSQIFWFSNSNFSTFPTSRKWKNFNFSHYPVPAEMLYLQKYLTNFQKLFFWLKDKERRYTGWKFEMHRHYSFAIATLQLFQHSEHVKFQLFPLHCPSRSPISSKAFDEFSKTFFYLKDKERRYCGLKFKMQRHFSFAIATSQFLQHPENVKISIFSLMLCLQKYLTNFQKLFFGWKMRNVAILVKNFKCTDILVLQ